MEDYKKTPLGPGPLGSRLVDTPNHPAGFRFVVIDGGGSFARLTPDEAKDLCAALRQLIDAGEL